MNRALICLKHYIQMSLFFSSPSNLPYNQNCIIYTLVAYVGVGILVLGDQYNLPTIVAIIFIETAIFAAISFIMLKFVKKPERLLQTISALIGVSLIISLISFFFISLLPTPTDEQQVSPLALIVLFWNLAVVSLIFKRSFEIRTIVAGFIAFNYFLLYELILINLF